MPRLTPLKLIATTPIATPLAIVISFAFGLTSCTHAPVNSNIASLSPNASRIPASEIDPSVEIAYSHFSETLLSLQKSNGEWDGDFISDATMDAISLIFSEEMGIHDSLIESQSTQRIFSLQDPITHLWLKFPGGPPSIETTGIVLYTFKKLGISETDPRLTPAWIWFKQQHSFKDMDLAAQFTAIATGEVEAHEIPYIDHLTTDFFSKSGKLSLTGIGSWKDMFVPFLVWRFYHSANTQQHKVLPMDPERLASGGKLFGKKISREEITSKTEFWAQEGIGWLVNHQQSDGSWCGYIPCTLYSSMALKAAKDAGVADFSTQISRGWQSILARRRTLPDGSVAQQASFSMVWDTARSLSALNLNATANLAQNIPQNLPTKAKYASAVDWLVSQQIKKEGNWSTELPDTQPGGWSFQLYNDFNPDTDDTGQVIKALLSTQDLFPEKSAQIEQAATLGLHWILDFQQKSGGFAAFTRANYRLVRDGVFLYGKISREHLPTLFLNPDNDVTARTIQVMQDFENKFPQSSLTARVDQAKIAACQDLNQKMKTPSWAPAGVWDATWMVDYLHGTSQVIEAFLNGRCKTPSQLSGTIQWLMAQQNGDGGWGESPISYDSNRFSPGETNLTQTEFVLDALMTYEIEFHKFKAGLALSNTEQAGQNQLSASIQNGIQFLLTQTRGQDFPQQNTVTETFIPKIWYVRYTLQPHYELVRTLGLYLQAKKVMDSSGQ